MSAIAKTGQPSKITSQHKLWFVVVLIYGCIIANKAVHKHDYIYDSKHYESVINAMEQDKRDIYFSQKCNSFDSDSGGAEPACYSVTTVDNGTMFFDVATPRSVADQVVKNYNDTAYKFILMASISFYMFFVLLWLIPSIIFYPVFEWFLDGFKQEYRGGRTTTAEKITTAVRVEKLITRYFKFLDGMGTVFNFVLGFSFSILLGIFDIITPLRYTFVMVYIFPIAMTTWFAGQTAGFVVTAVCVAFWSHTNQQDDLWAYSLNILSTLSIYFIVTIMLTKVRQMWETELALSRTDQLTGVMNRRAFDELVDFEILSLQRQNSPFSLAYLDLDNFKTVNDTLGHKKGDELLKLVASCLTENLRRTDVVARIGGDEFIIFFPATDQDAVRVVVQKLLEQLNLLNTQNNWPTTVSMGVITSSDSNCSLELTITQADKLMYEVKYSGKNNVAYLPAPEG